MLPAGKGKGSPAEHTSDRAVLCSCCGTDTRVTPGGGVGVPISKVLIFEKQNTLTYSQGSYFKQ